MFCEAQNDEVRQINKKSLQNDSRTENMESITNNDTSVGENIQMACRTACLWQKRLTPAGMSVDVAAWCRQKNRLQRRC